jgi:hypothetical protein
VADHPFLLAELGIDRGTFDHWRRRAVGPQMKRLPNKTWRIRGDWYDAWLDNLPAEGFPEEPGDELGGAA